MSSAQKNPYPLCAFRVWHGMGVKAWIRLLARNRFRLSADRVPLAVEVSAYAAVNSLLGLAQRARFGNAIAGTAVASPVFIVGHWRSGTTLLHELLTLDRQFASPNTFDCFAPDHSLLTRRLAPALGFLLPKSRPMDDMPMGWKHPQEDEFALLNKGLRSPYQTLAFPNEPRSGADGLDLFALPDGERRQWAEQFRLFLGQVTLRALRDGERARALLLKSPPHTARLRFLSDLFPDARFIHIVRNPYELFSSTVILWKVLANIQGLQRPRWNSIAEADALESIVFENLLRLYEDFEAARARLRDGRFCHVRYEDLTENPLRELSRIYSALDLDGFAEHSPAFTAYMERSRDYRPRRHVLDDKKKAQVAERWASYFWNYGYDA